MIGHQRDILATLGIDIWIPKGDVCQQHQVSIWRDQAPAELHSEIILPQPTQIAPVEKAPLIAPEPVTVEAKAEVKSEVPVIVASIQEQREILHIQPFNLQALSLEHCTIVIDATEMTEQTQHLWSNIQRALQSEFYELNWPFPWMNLQDGRGVESYIQGFLDMMSLEKNIISLGSIPHVTHNKMIQLASLQEMLDQPILKKRLWQFMQNRPENSE
ncbi:hypothetical protein O4M77_05810 [Acinetobacter sp. YWS30-1]|uniref:hypothetical protein n=1 Tax=Acinetobacter sp. YWS30-1 TaxID=2996862 RepID=UPI002B25FDCB|nr:hypothetical protein [Acinetobacter sp. YWS30-1]WPC35922.1 hypothetical protein O4M77_05810 [Acinetobacter sp. YWS30-1]